MSLAQVFQLSRTSFSRSRCPYLQGMGGLALPPPPDPEPTFSCPMCGNHFKLVNDKPAPAFWDRLNRVHASSSDFPSTTFLSTHDRLVSSTPGCHWIYHSRFKNMGCQRRVGPRKKCGGSLQLLDLNVIQSTPCSIHRVSPSPHSASYLFLCSTCDIFIPP